MTIATLHSLFVVSAGRAPGATGEAGGVNGNGEQASRHGGPSLCGRCGERERVEMCLVWYMGSIIAAVHIRLGDPADWIPLRIALYMVNGQI